MLSAADASHLLRRAGFGGRAAEIAAFTGLTREAAVDRLLEPSATDALPEWSTFADERRGVELANVRNHWIDRMIASPPSLAEKMVLFWHDHFATGYSGVQLPQLMWDQNVIFRTHGLGSFRDLLGAASYDAAMLRWLDNRTNIAGREQENFARELMELFTVGNGRFDETDVVAMARAWTGHNVAGRADGRSDYDAAQYLFRPDRHDDGDKTLFGITRNWDAEATLDELCFGSKATATADYLSRKLFGFFVHRSPSEEVIASLATSFRASGLDITSLVREILLLDEFWDPTTRYRLVKTPAEYVVDLFRRCELTTADHNAHARMRDMGMTLFEPPNVAGWGANGYWLHNRAAWTKANLGTWLRGRAPTFGYLQGLDGLSAEQVVDEILIFLGLVEVSPQSRAHVRTLVDRLLRDYPNWLNREPIMIGLSIPEVQCA